MQKLVASMHKRLTEVIEKDVGLSASSVYLFVTK
jgi:hypothetical protein